MTRAFMIPATLAAGSVGGSVFFFLHVPLAWMLGAFFLVACCSAFGAPMKMTKPVTLAGRIAVGLAIGLQVDADLVAGLSDWGDSVALLFACCLTGGAVMVYILCGRMRYPWKTGFFAAMPGGFIEMVIQADRFGGDKMQVTAIHLARIVFSISMLPFLLMYLGVEARNAPVIGPAGSEPVGWALPDLELLAVLAAGLAAAALLDRLRVPAAPLIGSLLVGAVVSAGFDIHPAYPIWLLPAGLVVIGASLGAQFAGLDLKALALALLHGVMAGVVMMIIGAGYAWIGAEITGRDFLTLLLCFAPAGMMEMSTVALALGLDAAYITSHHLIRIIAVIIAVSGVIAILERTGRLDLPPRS